MVQPANYLYKWSVGDILQNYNGYNYVYLGKMGRSRRLFAAEVDQGLADIDFKNIWYRVMAFASEGLPPPRMIQPTDRLTRKDARRLLMRIQRERSD
jgi:hypothetical protein